MKRNIKNFADEITNNFSELFVETFLLRYLNEFDKNDLLNGIAIVKKELDKKVTNRFKMTLKNMGYSNEDVNKFLK